MPKQPQDLGRVGLVQGTLDLLILQTLQWGPQHGHGIGHAIRISSDDLLQVEHGSLYPALHRWKAAVGCPPNGGCRRRTAGRSITK